MVMSFIEANAKDLGIDSICRELVVAPSSYHTHAARLADPAKRSAHTRRADEIRQAISDVHEASFGLCGTRKVWHQPAGVRSKGSTMRSVTGAKPLQVHGMVLTLF